MPEPKTLEETLDAYRAEVAAGEAVAFRQLDAVYARAWADVEAEVRRLEEAIAEAPLREVINPGTSGATYPSEVVPGTTMQPAPADVFQHARYLELQKQADSLIGDLARQLDSTLPATKSSAVSAALSEARDLGNIAEGWANVPDEAIRNLVGFASDGGPLAELFSTFRTQAGAAVDNLMRDTIASGMARGRGMNRVAADLRGSVHNLTARRAKTIVRTETQRAYREAHRQSYEANSKFIGGWIWRAGVHSAFGKPCSACWSMHGTVHNVDERLTGHPNCRCRMVPVRKDLMLGDELLLPGTDPLRETGHDVFSRLSAAEQRGILGPTRYELFRSGKIPMEGFGTPTVSSRWGSAPRTTTLKELRNRQSDPTKRAADAFLHRARTVEPEVSRMLSEIADQAGGDLAGFQHRLKSAEAFTGKIDRDTLAKGTTPLQAAGEIRDTVRYTLRLPDDKYGQGSMDAVQRLTAQGAVNTKWANTWGSDGYRGINSNWRLRNGMEIELQFHTSGSFVAKTLAHDIYELARKTLDPTLLARYDSEMAAIFGRVTIPKGAGTLQYTAPKLWPASTHLSPNLYRTVSFEEARIDTNRGSEEFVAMDGPDGRVLYRKGQAGLSVEFTEAEIRTMRMDGDRLQAAGQPFVFTHNHPAGYDQPVTDARSAGSSFSPQDWDMAASINVSEMRAISRSYVYSVKRPPGGWPDPKTSTYYSTVQGTVARIDAEVRIENYAKINAAATDAARNKAIAEAEANHWHQVAERAAEQLDAEYERAAREAAEIAAAATPPPPPPAPDVRPGANALYEQGLEGGFSVGRFGDVPTTGYMVSPYKGAETAIPIASFTPDAIRAFEAKNAELLALPDHYLGGWRDGDTFYLDVSVRTRTLTEAKRIAAGADQLAVYDVAKGESIQTGGPDLAPP